MDYQIREKVILVTGATGFVGGAIALELQSRGATVRAFVRDFERARFLALAGAQLAIGDMTDPESIEKAVTGCNAVIHSAAVVGKNNESWREFWLANVKGTRHLGLCAQADRIDRFVLISSIAVFGLDAGTGTSEASPRLRSGFTYPDTKIEEEKVVGRLVRHIGLPAITVYPTQIYGPNDTGWTGIPLNLIASGRMAMANGGSGLIQPIFISDLVDGVILALEKGDIGEGYILSGDQVVSVRDYYGYLADIAGRANLPSRPQWFLLILARLLEMFAYVTRKPAAFTRLGVLATTRTSTYDGDKAYRDLGFTPKIRLEDGMRKVEESVSTQPNNSLERTGDSAAEARDD